MWWSCVSNSGLNIFVECVCALCGVGGMGMVVGGGGGGGGGGEGELYFGENLVGVVFGRARRLFCGSRVWRVNNILRTALHHSLVFKFECLG